MPKTIQIRDIDDEVYAGLLRRAGEEGITVPELLRREAARLAARPSIAQWLARTGRRPWTTGVASGQMLIVDASCLFEVVADTPRAGVVAARLAADVDQAAPHVVDVEVMGVIRAQYLQGRLDGTAAGQAV